MSIELKLEPDAVQHLIDGLSMRICVIETGTYHLRATDVQNMTAVREQSRRQYGHSAYERMAGPIPKIKALDDDQLQLVADLLKLRDSLQRSLSSLGFGPKRTVG